MLFLHDNTYNLSSLSHMNSVKIVKRSPALTQGNCASWLLIVVQLYIVAVIIGIL